MSEIFTAENGTEFRGPDTNGDVWIVSEETTIVIPESDLVEYAGQMLDVPLNPQEMKAQRVRDILNLSVSLLEVRDQMNAIEAVERAAEMIDCAIAIAEKK